MPPSTNNLFVNRRFVPPSTSTNNLFVNRRFGKGRARAPAYEAWITEAGWRAKTQFPVAVHGAVRVHLALPFNRSRDIDNGGKPLLDLLVSLGIIDDDRWVDRLEIDRVPIMERECTVSIWPIPLA